MRGGDNPVVLILLIIFAVVIIVGVVVYLAKRKTKEPTGYAKLIYDKLMLFSGEKEVVNFEPDRKNREVTLISTKMPDADHAKAFTITVKFTVGDYTMTYTNLVYNDKETIEVLSENAEAIYAEYEKEIKKERGV